MPPKVDRGGPKKRLGPRHAIPFGDNRIDRALAVGNLLQLDSHIADVAAGGASRPSRGSGVSTRRMLGGVVAGSAGQSGSRSRIEAIVSEMVSPGNALAAGQHLVEHAAERPDVGALVDGLPRACSGDM